MQTTPVSAALPGGIPQAAGYAQGMTGGDGTGFEAMLMQMLGGNMEGMEGELFGQTAQDMLAQLQGKDQKDVTSQAAMEMMSALFMGAPTMLNLDLSPSPMAYQDGSQTNGPSLAESMQAVAGAAQSMQLNRQSVQAAMSSMLLESQTTSHTGTPLDSSLWQPAAETLAQTQAQQNEQQLVANLALQNPKAAQQLLSDGQLLEAQKTSPVALDPLQNAQLRLRQLEKNQTTPDDALAQLQAAQSPLADATTLVRTAAEKISDQAILQQVETGIRQHLKAGESEFTLKLRPEGLGEITVKLVEQQGRMSLSIITATQQAQTALSSQIGSLREALQPYDVQVTQVVSQQTLDFQQSMSQQHHSQQNQQQAQPHWHYQEESESPQLQQQYAAALSSALNTYI